MHKKGAEFFYVDSDEVEQEVKKLERLHKEMVRSKEELLDRIAREQKEG